jgi:hypothetical protein
MTDNDPRTEGTMYRPRLIVLVLALVCAGCAGGQATPAAPGGSTSTGTVGSAGPSFSLTLAGATVLPTYASDTNASLDFCEPAKGRGWTYMYAGGTPFVSVDLRVYSGAADGGLQSDFDLDIGAPAGQVRLVPSGRREGAKGTGTAIIEERQDTVTITVRGTATTMAGGSNVGDTEVELILACPR